MEDEDVSDYYDEVPFLQAVEDINSTVAMQGKAEIFRLLTRITPLYHELETRNAVLRRRTRSSKKG